jgi:hypothetical protein
MTIDIPSGVLELQNVTEENQELKARITQLEAVNELRSVPPGWMPQPDGNWVKNSQRNGMEYHSKARFHQASGHWLWNVETDDKGILWGGSLDATVYVCQAMHNADKALEKFLIS